MRSPFLGPGDRVAGFRVLEQLGAGGMGVVYRAWEENLGREVALKLVSPLYADDAEFRRRFAAEARALAALDSPHVVAVHSHGEADGHLYLATQLIPDGDLATLLQRHGPLPLDVALRLVAQVAAGLADVHAAGVVHRDVKPGNVLLRRRPDAPDGLQAYLGDFGIARRAEAASVTGLGVVGTPAYLAPEVADGAPATAASDLYALGCLFWMTLTGRPPYEGPTPFAVAAAHRAAPVPQVPASAGTPASVALANRVLRHTLAKVPAQRYPSAAVLRDELAAAGAAPTRARPRRAWPVLAVAGVVVVAGGVTAGLLTGGSGAGSGSLPPFTDLTANEIAVAAEKEMKVLDSVHLDGVVSQGGQTITLDLTVTSDGQCDGQIGFGGTVADLRRIGSDTWLRGGASFWTALLGEQSGPLVAGTVGGSWGLLAPEVAADFADACDLDELVEDAGGTDPTARKGAVTTVGGREAITLTTEQAAGLETSYIATSEPHYLLEVEGGPAGTVRFSEFDVPLDAEPPPDSDVVDLGALG